MKRARELNALPLRRSVRRPFPFLDLLPELQREVVKFLDYRERSRLARCCRYLHGVFWLPASDGDRIKNWGRRVFSLHIQGIKSVCSSAIKASVGKSADEKWFVYWFPNGLGMDIRHQRPHDACKRLVFGIRGELALLYARPRGERILLEAEEIDRMWQQLTKTQVFGLLSSIADREEALQALARYITNLQTLPRKELLDNEWFFFVS
jgi:hypothetical protein